jgi:Ca2+/Na+ antiporter
METPASDNLITGSSFGILFGIPVLLLISFAAKSDTSVWFALLLIVLYMAVLIMFIFKAGKRKKKK